MSHGMSGTCGLYLAGRNLLWKAFGFSLLFPCSRRRGLGVARLCGSPCAAGTGPDLCVVAKVFEKEPGHSPNLETTSVTKNLFQTPFQSWLLPAHGPHCPTKVLDKPDRSSALWDCCSFFRSLKVCPGVNSRPACPSTPVHTPGPMIPLAPTTHTRAL